MTSDPNHTGFYAPGHAVGDPRQKSCNASMIDDGILLPGFDCVNPECRGWTGTAREDHKVCRFCGTPRQDDGARAYVRSVKEHLDHPVTGQHLRAVYENLDHVQERCTELLFENRDLKAMLRRWLSERSYVPLPEETEALLEKYKKGIL